MTALVVPEGQELRLAPSRREAAHALGMSLSHRQRHVQPHIACVYSGQLRLYPVAELERWLDDRMGVRPCLKGLEGFNGTVGPR